jgi:hypothetical protein
MLWKTYRPTIRESALIWCGEVITYVRFGTKLKQEKCCVRDFSCHVGPPKWTLHSRCGDFISFFLQKKYYIHCDSNRPMCISHSLSTSSKDWQKGCENTRFAVTIQKHCKKVYNLLLGVMAKSCLRYEAVTFLNKELLCLSKRNVYTDVVVWHGLQ